MKTNIKDGGNVNYTK